MTDYMTDREKEDMAARGIMPASMPEMLDYEIKLPKYVLPEVKLDYSDSKACSDRFEISVDWDAIVKQYAEIGIDIAKVSEADCLSIKADCEKAHLCSIATASDSYSSSHSQYLKNEIEELKRDLEAKDAKFKEKSKEYDEILVEKNHQLDVLRNTIMMLENKIRYCKKNGIWAEKA